MKKIILALAAVVALSGSAFAQQNDCCKQKKECCTKQKSCCDKKEKCHNPFEGLELTAEQQAKLDAIRTECKAKKECNREERLAKIKAVLTPEQYTKFLENSAKKHHKGHKHNK